VSAAVSRSEQANRKAPNAMARQKPS
jgi:hypothetical protein